MSGERTLHTAIQAWYDAHGREVEELARTIWAHPEPAMEEFTACRAAGSFLEAQGFSVKTYHCRDEALPPNTVEATAGSGFPVIGIYGEYDALPGLGQEAVPRPAPIPGCGHGCGHSLMTPAGASAAAAAWRALQAENLPGTIRFIACPAEETGEGKAELLRHGAFDGLEKIVEARLDRKAIGFNTEISHKTTKEIGDLLQEVTPQDLVKFGLIPEFVGRVPICVSLRGLDREALVRILKEPKNALIKQYRKLFDMDGVELNFEEEAVNAIAGQAFERKTGARGLRSIMESILMDIMYRIPSDETIEECVITKATVEEGSEPKTYGRNDRRTNLDKVI